ncbi:hypothetical protein ASD54_12250 [Rhizobium sp. Root149]|uniref:hypothetical protein n=1 Tax=Rhizobium sp. Root149 TaxID=1736473 RepID=UPI000714C0D8|nr:hypothetical protein [Rhizobium sp. Root149]KQZ49703.1 hypothetical protein ASD54_12250 [Rhizobium sp. Root149]
MATADEVQQAYQSLFGRSADAGGLDYWVNSGKTGNDLINSLTGAAQGSDRSAIVNNSYSDLFGRQAETAGSNFWTSDDSWNKYASGGLDNLNLQIGGGSQGSDEYKLIDNLKGSGGKGWAETFFDPVNSKSVWNALLDEEGFNGKGAMPDLASILKQLQQKQPTASAGGGASTSSGGYKDYQNPFTEDVLNAAIRKMTDAGDRQRNALGTQAFGAGAYGDARHGVESDRLTQSLLESIGDLSATTNAQGFESAMGWFNRDLDRQANVAYQNAMLQNQWTQNQISGSDTANKLGLNDYTQNVNWLSFLNGLDQYDRGWTQNDLNANYQDFWAQQNWDQNQLTALLNVLNAIPGQSTTTAVNTQPDNSWASMLGSSLSSAFGGGSSSKGGYSTPAWIV